MFKKFFIYTATATLSIILAVTIILSVQYFFPNRVFSQAIQQVMGIAGFDTSTTPDRWRWLKVDSNDNLLVSLGTRLDSTNDSVSTVPLGGDVCQSTAKIFVTIDQTADTQYVTGTASEFIHICSINIVAAAAESFSIVTGTGSVCATGRQSLPGLGGGAVDGDGYSFAANGGLTYGSGGFTLAESATAADNLCVHQSGSGQVSGGFSYVSAA